MVELTEEQIQALEQQKEPLKLVNPHTQEVFVLIRQEIHALTNKILKSWDDPEDDDLIANETRYSRSEAERLPDVPWLDDSISAPFDLPRPGVAERVQPRPVSKRLPELPTGLGEELR